MAILLCLLLFVRCNLVYFVAWLFLVIFSSFISDTDTQDDSSNLRQFEHRSMHRQGDAGGDGTADEVVTKIPGPCLNSCMVPDGAGNGGGFHHAFHSEFPDSGIFIDVLSINKST